jgi:hypothetical protein
MATPQDPNTVAGLTLSTLRPLSLGELLDRAFSICFKHLLAFIAIVAVVFIPQLVLNYLAMNPYLQFFTHLIQQASAGNPAPPNPGLAFQALADGGPYFVALIVVTIFFIPLSNAAVVSGVSRAYLGMPVRFADCYGDAVRRWPVLLGLMLLWFLAAFLALITGFLAMFVLGLILAGLGSTLHAVGVVLAVIVGIAGFAVLLILGIDVYLAAAFSFVAAVLEGVGAANAFSSGFRRVFGDRQFWRSVAIGATIFGIIFALDIVAEAISGVTFALTHMLAFNFVVAGIVNAFAYPFAFAVVAVAYYDVRIRREGFDLQMLATRLGVQTPAPTTQ